MALNPSQGAGKVGSPWRSELSAAGFQERWVPAASPLCSGVPSPLATAHMTSWGSPSRGKESPIFMLERSFRTVTTRKYYFWLNLQQFTTPPPTRVTVINWGKGGSPKISQKAASGLDRRGVQEGSPLPQPLSTPSPLSHASREQEVLIHPSDTQQHFLVVNQMNFIKATFKAPGTVLITPPDDPIEPPHSLSGRCYQSHFGTEETETKSRSSPSHL